MAIHRAGEPELDTSIPQLGPDRLHPHLQLCTRCGLRLTRPYQRFPVGAAIEIAPTYTAMKLGGVPDCTPSPPTPSDPQ